MFTGLIEETGEIIENVSMGVARRLRIRAGISNLTAGESLAINGVCLTLLPDADKVLEFDVSPETLRCSTLGALMTGETIHIERAMSGSMRFGGHYVSGHVDAAKAIKKIKPVDEYLEIQIGQITAEEKKYVLPKGSITVDGVSLTINDVEEDRINLLLVPHTVAKTALGTRKVGDQVNIEFDYLAKMIAHQVSSVMNEYK